MAAIPNSKDKLGTPIEGPQSPKAGDPPRRADAYLSHGVFYGLPPQIQANHNKHPRSRAFLGLGFWEPRDPGLELLGACLSPPMWV